MNKIVNKLKTLATVIDDVVQTIENQSLCMMVDNGVQCDLPCMNDVLEELNTKLLNADNLIKHKNEMIDELNQKIVAYTNTQMNIPRVNIEPMELHIGDELASNNAESGAGQDSHIDVEVSEKIAPYIAIQASNIGDVDTGEIELANDISTTVPQVSMTQSLLVIDLTENIPGKEFRCKLCGETFVKKYRMRKHRKTHHQKQSPSMGETMYVENKGASRVRPHMCDICDRSFKHKYYLDTHRRKHTGDKVFQCNHCDRSFDAKRDVEEHTTVHSHTGVKPYACDLCGKKFNHLGTRNVHRLTHQAQKNM